MKKILLLIWLGVVSFNTLSFGKSLKYSFSGAYTGNTPFRYVTLNFIPANGARENIIIHCPIKDGKFRFNGTVEIGNRSFIVAIIYLENEKKNQTQLDGNRDGFHDNWTTFIVEPKVHINIKNDIRSAELSGGQISSDFMAFQKSEKVDAVDNFITKHTQSVVSLYYIKVLAKVLDRFKKEELYKRTLKLYTELNPKLKSTPEGITVRKTLDDFKSYAEIKSDHYANVNVNDFLFRNLSDAPVKNIVKSSRLTVLHFWASWCLPCIKEFPVLKQQSKLAADGNAAKVVLVSIDNKTAPWKTAIAKQGLNNFTHYLDVSNPTFLSKDLETKSIPYNILVNDQGKILEHDFKTSEIMEVVRKNSDR